MTFSKNTDLALLLIRLVFGGLMIIQHGWGKMIKLTTGHADEFGDPIGLGAPVSLALAAFAEVICAILVIIGFYTRLAVIPLIITMLVAAFIANMGEPLGKIELSLLYLAAFIALGISGPGWYSVDGQLRKP